MNRAPLRIVSLLGLASLPCVSWAQAPATGPAPPPPATVPAAAEQLALAEPVVTLLELGEEPRRELRYRFAKGDAHTLGVTMTMSTKTSLGAMQMPEQKQPAMRFIMSTTVTEVAGGEITYDLKFTHADVADAAGAAPHVVAMTRNALKSAVGMGGAGVITDRGFTKGFEFNPPPANPMMKQQLEGLKQIFANMCLPLPQEPVGVGGKWQTVTTLSQNGLSLVQKTVTTVTSLEGDKVGLDIELQESAEPQDLAGPGMPPGAKLKSLESKGAGKRAASLTQLVPIRSTMERTNDTTMTVNMGDAEQDLLQHMEMSVAMEGDPEPEPEAAPESNPQTTAPPKPATAPAKPEL